MDLDANDFAGPMLALPTNAIGHAVGEHLAALSPGRVVLESEGGYFDVEAFAEGGGCRLTPRAGLHQQIVTSWDEEFGLRRRARNARFDVDWGGKRLELLVLTWNAGFRDESHAWLVADDRPTAEAFFSEVAAWNAEVRDEVLVFDGGCWSKSDGLFRSIRGATFENLVLAGSLKAEIRDDLARFFASREVYEGHGVPWKRGVLFIGPPGNGKTHAVKAIVNGLGRPCLYVKGFQSDCSTEHDCVREVFRRARKSAPCVLVLEDLDSLINDGNRSFFLNELDGFAANTGVATLATTNHPDRLDPAIVDRPSRFDRKYHFDLPGPAERLAYSRLRAASMAEALRPTEAGLAELAGRTDGFSFAYMKELFVSAMMRWVGGPPGRPIDAILAEQADLLRSQMATPAPAAPGP